MTRRLAFVLEVDPDDFARLAQENGWTPVDAGAEQDESSDEDRPERRWQVPGGEVRFVDDTVVEVQYVDISAEPSAPIEETIDAELRAYDKETCLQVLDLSKPEATVSHALRLLATTAPGDFDQRVFDATASALQDEREKVRYWALKIANYTEWTQFLPEVSRLASSDPSQTVRTFATNSKLLLEAIGRIPRGQ